MAGLAAHDAMSRFHSRQSAGASGAGELIAVDERLEHLALDFDFLVGQSDLLELAREPRDGGALRRGLAARPALSPPSHAWIFPRCATLEPFTNSQDARRLDVDCSQFGLSRTLSSFVVVRPVCQPARNRWRLHCTPAVSPATHLREGQRLPALDEHPVAL